MGINNLMNAIKSQREDDLEELPKGLDRIEKAVDETIKNINEIDKKYIK